ncbi:hypothetical protein Tco_1291395 [Tanacetum coccineum]
MVGPCDQRKKLLCLKLQTKLQRGTERRQEDEAKDDEQPEDYKDGRKKNKWPEKSISRDDLIELYRIVMNRYGLDGPEDKLEKGFWKCLRIMFEEPLSTDSIWSEIEQQKIVKLSLSAEVKGLAWLLQSKRLAGKELSNPFIADDLLKIIWLSMYHGLTNLNIDYQDWSAMKTSCCQDLKS